MLSFLSNSKFKLYFLLYICSLLWPVHVSAQQFDSIAIPSIYSDINSTRAKALAGIKISCSNEVVDAKLDSTLHLVTITTILKKNHKSIMVYDLNGKKAVWEREVNSKKYSVIHLDNYIILTSATSTICINKVSGEELWKSKRELVYVNNKNEVAFTYYSHFDSSRPDILLEAIRLSDGKKIWKRAIDREFGWSEIININDSTVILSASGLHCINLKNGKGWDYNALTGASIPVDTKINPLIYLAYFGSAVLLGPIFIFPIYYFTNTNDLLWDLCSNMLVEDGHIYYASRQTICALDLNGNKVWQTQLPNDISGNSRLVIKDSMLVLINKGTASKGLSKVYYGAPYLSAFYRFTGEQTYLKQIHMEEHAITDFQLQNGSSFLIQKDKLTEYSGLNGELMNRERIVDLEKQKGSSFISADNFLVGDNINSTFSSNSDSLLYVFIPGKGVIMYNNKLNELGKISDEKLYLKIAHTSNSNIYKSKEEVVITDLNFNKLYTLKTNKRPIYDKGSLIVYDKNSVSIFTID